MENDEEPSETSRSIPKNTRLEPQWVVGFTDGEGCFFIGINEHSDMASGFQVLPEFTIVQHERDIQLLYALKGFFGCGVVRTNHGNRMCFRVRKLEHLKDIIVPFFERHTLKSKKRLDFLKFRMAVRMMSLGQHLTEEGIGKIKAVAQTLNTGRER